jgi:hypothetical protein
LSATGTAGTAFSYQITASNSPTSFGATGLPAGLSVNTTSGSISGTPTTAGTSDVTLSATNSGGTGTATLTLTFNAPLSTITYVQGNYATSQSNHSNNNNNNINKRRFAVSFPGAQTAGNLIVVVVGWSDSTATVTGITDSSGNTYNLAVGPTIQPGVASQTIYHAANIAAAAAGTNAVTVTFSSAPQSPNIRILEYNGADPNNPVDVTAASSGNSGTSDSGLATTTNATDLIFGANLVQTLTSGPGNGFIARLLTSPNRDIAEDQMVTAVGSYKATAPISSGKWIMQMVAFRSAGSVTAKVATPAIGTRSAVVSASSSLLNKPGEVDFTIPQNGGVKWLLAGNSGSAITGYGNAHMSTAASASGVVLVGERVNGVLVSEAALPASPSILSGRTYVNLNAPVTTGVALANPGSQDAVISFYFTDATGTDFGRGSFTLTANSLMQTYLNQPPFNGPPSLEGTFTFSSTVPLGAVALQGLTNQAGEFLYTTVPLAPITGSTSDPVLIPDFANGGGWTTQVILINPSDSPISGTVQFFSQRSATQDGQPARITVNGTSNSIFNYSMLPHTGLQLRTSGGGSTTESGSVRIIPSGRGAPASAAVLSYTNNGITVTEASVAGAPSATEFQTYAETAGTAGQAGSIETWLAMANPSPNPVTVNLTLIQMDGSVLGQTVPVTVPGRGQITASIQSLISAPSNFQGFLTAASDSPIVFTGLHAHYNERGELLITETRPRNNAETSNSDVILPEIVSGGAYTTQIILFGASGNGKLQLNSQGGSLR